MAIPEERVAALRQMVADHPALSVLLNGMTAGWSVYYAANTAACEYLEAALAEWSVAQRAQFLQDFGQTAKTSAIHGLQTAQELHATIDETLKPLLSVLASIERGKAAEAAAAEAPKDA